jgi:hypothetical protein
MPGKPTTNGSLYCLQIPAYRDLLAQALGAQADQVKEVAAREGIPQVMKSTEDFLRAAAQEISTYTTSE